MVKVLCPHFLGLTVVCSGCGALLGYKGEDVYDGVIYCPICNEKLMCIEPDGNTPYASSCILGSQTKNTNK